MLKSQLLHPQILAALAKSGHGSKVLISDGNYPHWTKHGPNAEVVYLNLSPGQLLVTDVLGQRLLHVAKSGQVKVLAKFSAGGADFGYIGAKRIAVVPFLFDNRVAAFDLTNALK